MLLLARWLSRSAFGIGIAIGLILNLGILPALEPAKAQDGCADAGGQTEEAIDWTELQCSIQAALFADGSVPGIAFNLGRQDPSKPGKYTCSDWRGQQVTFAVANVVSADLKTDAPDLYSQGVIARVLYGQMFGPAGSCGVMGVCLLPNGITADDQFIFLPCATLTTQELADQEGISRIAAGVKVLDTATYRTIGLSELQSADSMWAAPGELATLFATHVNAGAGGPGLAGEVDPECVKRAYEDYNLDMDAANLNLATDLSIAAAAFAGALVACALIALGATPINWAVAAACATKAALLAAGIVADATKNYAQARYAANQKLKLQLSRCGVYIAEA